MDAVMFIKERKRMCDSLDSCVNCPLNDDVCGDCDIWVSLNVETAVNSVEKWSTAHPRKTRQSVFMEQWPDVYLDGHRVIAISPCALSKEYRGIDCSLRDCAECRKEFWTQEVK